MIEAHAAASTLERGCLRPSVPPIVWSALSLWAGVVAAEYLVWARIFEHPRSSYLVVFAAACILSTGIPIFRRSARYASRLLVLAGLSAGLVCGYLYWSGIVATARIFQAGTSIQASGIVTEDPIETEHGAIVRVRLSGLQWRKTNIAAFWPGHREIPRAGQSIVASGVVAEKSTSERAARRAQRRGEAFRLDVTDVTLGTYSTTPVGLAASARQ